MIDYSQFTQALEICVKHNIKLSHISSLVSKGYDKVEFLQSGSGVLTFRFFGKSISTAPFKSRDSFYKESKLLVSQEPLAYALVDSCVDAEKSATKGVPSSYKIVIYITDAEVFRYKVAVPQS